MSHDDERLEYLQKVLQQTALMRQSYSDYRASRDMQKSRKARWKADKADLVIMLDQDPSQQKLSFHSDSLPARDATVVVGEEIAAAQDSNDRVADITSGETVPSWQSYEVSLLEEFGVSKKQCLKLAVHLAEVNSGGELTGSPTMSDLQVLTKSNEKWSMYVTGIGETAQEKIEVALAEFISKHQKSGDINVETASELFSEL